MKIKNKMKIGLLGLGLMVSPFVIPNGIHYAIVREGIEQGYSKQAIEKVYRENAPKRSPFIGTLTDYVTRPGRNLAYMTAKEPFPWRGYAKKRTVKLRED